MNWIIPLGEVEDEIVPVNYVRRVIGMEMKADIPVGPPVEPPPNCT